MNSVEQPQTAEAMTALKAAQNDRQYRDTIVRCAEEMRPLCASAGISLKDFLNLHLAFCELLSQSEVDDGREAAATAQWELDSEPSPVPDSTCDSWFVDSLSQIVTAIQVTAGNFRLRRGEQAGDIVLDWAHASHVRFSQTLHTKGKTKYELARDFYHLVGNEEQTEL